jgi:HK97 family phage prohead protease
LRASTAGPRYEQPPSNRRPESGVEQFFASAPCGNGARAIDQAGVDCRGRASGRAGGILKGAGSEGVLEAFDLSSTSGINLKKTPDKNSISGYGAIFGTLDADNEIIDRGAFASSLAQSRRTGKPILMLWQHQESSVIGTWDSFSEDSKGLLCKGHILPTVQRGSEALALLAAKAIGDLSIGFKTVRATRINGVRHIQEVRLFEVSLVSFASNSEACVTEAGE